MRVLGRAIEVPLTQQDVGRVLAATPDPFSPATLEKRAALRHFQPHGVLISRGADRTDRRAFNEAVLEPQRPLHDLAPGFVAIVHDEGRRLLDAAQPRRLDWEQFDQHWQAAVRRITLGEQARDDAELTADLDTLRRAGNWAYLHPRAQRRRARVQRAIGEYVTRAESGSLAAAVAQTPAKQGVDPAGQIPHWLFAFDAAGIAIFRALALLATHPEQSAQARTETSDVDADRPRQLPYLRACVLESVRLWPTTPALLRESTRTTAWGPSGTTSLIYTPFFHRDTTTAYADRFTPDIWLDGRAEHNPALVPFSGGPGQCPGRNIVLLTTSTMLATLLRDHEFTLTNKPGLRADQPLPTTVDNFTLEFALRHRG